MTENLIDEELDKVRDRNSRLITVEDRPAQNGDTAVIDFEGFVDGVAFEGGKAEKYNLALGSGNFIPGFEEQVVGHEIGEEFTISVSFPEDYQAEELKGKAAEFKIKLHELKEKELPEVDDEFVQDISDKETVTEYRNELKETLATRLADEAEQDFDNQISEKLIELAQGDIPEQMYDNQANDMVREFENRLRSQGMDPKMYMQYTGMDINGLKDMYMEEAEKRVKLRLVLEAIAKQEKVDVNEDDIEREYNKMAETYKMDTDKIKKVIPVESLSEDIRVQKALDIVKNSAVIK